jgi:hypothetical protein
MAFDPSDPHYHAKQALSEALMERRRAEREAHITAVVRSGIKTAVKWIEHRLLGKNLGGPTPGKKIERDTKIARDVLEQFGRDERKPPGVAKRSASAMAWRAGRKYGLKSKSASIDALRRGLKALEQERKNLFG